MNRPKTWFEFHAAKFEADTAHLTLEEKGAYLTLLNFHFLHDSIPTDLDRLKLILRESKQKTRKIIAVLSQFFYEENGRFYQKRMVETIAKVTEKSKVRREAALKRWDAKADANADANADTVTVTVTNKEKKESKEKKPPRRTRLPADWSPSEKLIAYCNEKRPDLDHENTFQDFKDYYLSHGKTMADWDLTAMRWVRNERQTTRQGPGKPPVRESAHERSQRIIREQADEIARTL